MKQKIKGKRKDYRAQGGRRVLVAASVASMIDQFNLPNIRLLQELGYEVHVAYNFAEGSTCGRKRVQKLQVLLVRMGVVCHQWDCPRGLDAPLKCLKAYGQLWKLTGCCHFAWMHCHSPVGGALARIVAHQRGIPAVYTAHGFHFYHGAPLKNWLLYYPAEKLLAYWTDVLVTVNQEDFWFAKQNLRAKRIRWIPGVGIASVWFSKGQARMTKEEFCSKCGLPADARILLSAGELSSRKNHRLVIEALPYLEQDTCYVICGRGRLRGTLLALAKELGVAERVCLTGYVEDLREVYQHADLFVLPSLQEGLPIALAQAMASGLACLVSDIRGNRELVRQQDGRFMPDSQESFLSRAAALLGDQKLLEQNAAQGRRRAEAYRLQKSLARMRRIYEEM